LIWKNTYAILQKVTKHTLADRLIGAVFRLSTGMKDGEDKLRR